MAEVRNVIGMGLGQRYEYTYKMAGLLLCGQNVVIEHVPNERGLHQVIGTISALWEYSVEPHGQSTVLNIEVEYTIPIPVLGRLAERIAIRQNDKVVRAFAPQRERRNGSLDVASLPLDSVRTSRGPVDDA